MRSSGRRQLCILSSAQPLVFNMSAAGAHSSYQLFFSYTQQSSDELRVGCRAPDQSACMLSILERNINPLLSLLLLLQLMSGPGRHLSSCRRVFALHRSIYIRVQLGDERQVTRVICRH